MTRSTLSDSLVALEARWRHHQTPILGKLRPGLSDGEMDDLVAPIGYTLDEEQRAWWSWSDGLVDGAQDTPGA